MAKPKGVTVGINVTREMHGKVFAAAEDLGTSASTFLSSLIPIMFQVRDLKRKGIEMGEEEVREAIDLWAEIQTKKSVGEVRAFLRR